MSDSLPPDDGLDDLAEPGARAGADPVHAYDGGWEEGIEEGQGLEDHLLGESPTTPEV